MKVQPKSYIALLLICLLFALSGCGSDEASAMENSEPSATAAPIAAEEDTTTHDHKTEAAHTSSAPTKASPAETSPTEASAAEDDASTNDVSSAASSDDIVNLEIVMNDSYFGDSDTNMEDPPVWTVTSEQTVIVNFANHGDMRHNWAIVKLDSNIPASFDIEKDHDILLSDPGMVYAHSQTQWVFRAPEPGEYKVICTVNGHYPTMQGKLIVTAE